MPTNGLVRPTPRIVAPAAAACGAALALCLAATAAAPTKASWANAANAACRTENASIRALPPELSTTALIGDLAAITVAVTHADEQIAAIPYPAVEKQTIDGLLAKVRTQLHLVTRQLLPILEHRGSAARARALVKEVSSLNVSYNADARALDARVCAENPVPSLSTATV